MRSLRFLTFLALAVAPLAASAFTLETAYTEGCHERATYLAAQHSGWPATPPAMTAEDQKVVDNLSFRMPAGFTVWDISLLIGVRDSDLHGTSIGNLVGHDLVDYSPADQRDHCLRAPADVYAAGDEAAAQSCRDFLLQEVSAAIQVYGKTEAVPVSLNFSQEDVTVDGFAYRLGQALHTVEDSFSHTYRTGNFRHLVRVFNYVSPALSPDYTEDRNGHAHSGALDHCDNPGAFEAARFQAAKDATSALATAAMADLQQAPTTLPATHAFLDEWFSFDSSCTEANAWCGVKAKYDAVEKAAGCSAAGAPSALGLLMVAGMAMLRRRRDRRDG